MEALDERLQSATQMPLQPPYRLSTLIAENVPQVPIRDQAHILVWVLGCGREGAQVSGNPNGKRFIQ